MDNHEELDLLELEDTIVKLIEEYGFSNVVSSLVNICILKSYNVEEKEKFEWEYYAIYLNTLHKNLITKTSESTK